MPSSGSRRCRCRGRWGRLTGRGAGGRTRRAGTGGRGAGRTAARGHRRLAPAAAQDQERQGHRGDQGREAPHVSPTHATHPELKGPARRASPLPARSAPAAIGYPRRSDGRNSRIRPGRAARSGGPGGAPHSRGRTGEAADRLRRGDAQRRHRLGHAAAGLRDRPPARSPVPPLPAACDAGGAERAERSLSIDDSVLRHRIIRLPASRRTPRPARPRRPRVGPTSAVSAAAVATAGVIGRVLRSQAAAPAAEGTPEPAVTPRRPVPEPAAAAQPEAAPEAPEAVPRPHPRRHRRHHQAGSTRGTTRGRRRAGAVLRRDGLSALPRQTPRFEKSLRLLRHRWAPRG